MPPFRDLLKEMDYSVPQKIEIIQGSERGKNVSDEKEVSAPEEKDKKEDLLPHQNGEKDERKQNTVPFHKLFQFASPLDIIYMIIGTIGAIVDGMSLPFMTIMLGELLDSYGNNTGNLNKLLHEVSRVALKMFYLGLGASVASFCEVTLWMCSGERQAARIRQLYLKAILRQDIAYFDKGTSTGEVVERMCGDTSLVQEAIGEKVAKFIRLLSVFLSGFVIAFFRGWLLTLVMLSTIPPVVVCGAIMGMVIAKATDAGQKSYGNAASLVEQVVSGIRTVASFTGEKKAVEQYDRALKKAYKSSLYQGLASGLSLGIMFLIFFAGYALALWYGSKLIMNNHGYTGGKVINIILVVLLGSMSLGQSSPCLAAFSAGQAAAYNIFAVIHRVPPIDIYDSKGLTIENFEGSIELQNVEFAYPARPDVIVFKQFCLEIPSGVTAALVGESGSGKSTVIRLINRFYDPQSGEVMLDGINIKKLQLKWTRQQIGLVSQEPILFNMSIKENIAYGNENATLDEIKAAASLANAANFIHVLPQGYATEVGQSGSKISGGQKQRIAIARAILRNPKILLLDEATSALDTASERLVQEALDRIMANHTTVVVAHRFSTIKNANLIAVVQNGTVVEKGTHNELLKNTHGAYSQLARLQEMHKGKKIHFDPNVKEQEPTILRQRSRSSPPDTRQQAEPSKIKEDIEAAVPKETSIFRLASLNKPETPVALLGSLAAITNGTIFPVYGFLLSSMIATFYQTNHHKLRKDADFWAMMFVFLGLIMLVAAPLQSYCFAIVGSRLVRRIRKMVFANVVRQEISWFDNSANSSGAISARLSTDAISVRTMVGDSLALVVQNIATAITGLLIAFTASWQLSLIFIAMGPLMSVQGLVQVKMVTGFSGDSKIKYEEATQIATDAVSNIRTVASFCAEEKVLELYERRCDIPLRNGLRTAIVSGVGMAISTIIQFGSQSLIFWYGAQMVHDGKTTFKAVLKVFFAIMLSAFSISQTIGMTPDVSKAKASINSIFAMLDKKSSIDSTNNVVGKVLDTVKGDINIQHVSFRYPTRPDVQIFQDLSLFIQAGKNIALVGESGSGKSTIIALIERFYDPNSGQIFLDGVDIKELKLRWLRQQIGLVSQEPILFSGTIKSNIAYGKEGLLTNNEIYGAAEIANANNFIMMLPNGYETEVGERGIQLSGGQKQRISIARAIIKNPKVLLLDEATSALDAESERVVQDALDRIMIGRSTIIVAHRLSTILNASMIIVLKNGVVVEKGTHNDLVRIDGGTYSSLVKLHY